MSIEQGAVYADNELIEELWVKIEEATNQKSVMYGISKSEAELQGSATHGIEQGITYRILDVYEKMRKGEDGVKLILL